MPKFATRLLLRLVIASFGSLPLMPVEAGAPMAQRAAPGFYPFRLGNFEVTVISDGTEKMDVGPLLSVGEKRTDQALARSHEREPYEFSFNSFLINTGSKLILVDTGWGNLRSKTTGHLVDNLRAAGYRPEQVDEIYITHMHADHVGGLARDGRRVFPNAIVRANASEAAWWLNDRNIPDAPKITRPLFKLAQDSLRPYISANRFKPFKSGESLAPGVRAVDETGHTPGHTGYLFESGGHRLLLWGDVIHVAEVQLADPTVTFAFDNVPKEAASVREAELRSLANDGTIVGAAHVSFPGLGHITKTASGYAWATLPYSASPLPYKAK